MNPQSHLLPTCLVCALGVLASAPPANAQSPAPTSAQAAALKPGGHLTGLHIGRSGYGVRCSFLPVCGDSERYLRLWGRTMLSDSWGAELGLVDMGRVALDGGSAQAQGVSLSVVRQFSLSDMFSAYGRFGTTYGQTSTAAVGSGLRQGTDNGFGLSYGAGLSWQVSPRLSAVLEWDSTDFRFVHGARDPVRATSLGLQYRY